MSIEQSKIFLDSEGDHWFKRNEYSVKTAEGYFETEMIKMHLNHFKDEINSILEIGCGNGAKLSALCNFFNVKKGIGIDPSLNATESGNARFSNVQLEQGVSSNLPFFKEQFDLVYIGFCAYLMDRHDIFKMVAEVDKVLRPGGFLAIHDFDPMSRHKRPYHHKQGLFSFKTSYSDFFMSSGHYYLVSKNSMGLKSHQFQMDSNDRASLCILYKEIDAYPDVL